MVESTLSRSMSPQNNNNDVLAAEPVRTSTPTPTYACDGQDDINIDELKVIQFDRNDVRKDIDSAAGTNTISIDIKDARLWSSASPTAELSYTTDHRSELLSRKLKLAKYLHEKWGRLTMEEAVQHALGKSFISLFASLHGFELDGIFFH